MKAGFVAILMFCSVAVFAQPGGGKSSVMDKLWFGGGGSFGGGTNSVGNRYFYYSIFPMIGYKVTEPFSVGTAVSYMHYDYPDYGVTYNQYGFMPFARYSFGNLFFWGEYDAINSPSFDNTSDRQLYHRMLFGAGYSQRFSSTGRGAINAMAMYDILYKQPSVFNSPIVFRVFVTF